MCSAPNYTKTALVNELIQAVIDYKITIEPMPKDTELESMFLREVTLAIGRKKFRCLTNNECGDMDDDNIPLKLSMILMELDGYTSATDFLEWAYDQEMHAGSVTARRLWDQLQENIVEIPKCFPNKLQALSSSDWELGSGGTRDLRGLPHHLARPDLHRYTVSSLVQH